MKCQEPAEKDIKVVIAYEAFFETIQSSKRVIEKPTLLI